MTANTKGRILLADYQSEPARGLSAILSGDGYDVIPSDTFAHSGRILDSDDINAAITHLESPRSDGMRLFEYIMAVRPEIPVIFLTARETVDVAAAAIAQGAFHYFITPPDYPQLKSIIARAVEQYNLRKEIEYLKEKLSRMTSAHRIIGDTPEMRKTIEVMEAVKESACSVLISGETGTGKELIARTLHQRSARSSAPFISVNCGAIPAEFLEDELFGLARMPFNGSREHKRSKFKEAGNGVIFLDEVGQLGPRIQARLLQVLGDGPMKREDSNEKVEMRFRLVSATTENLKEKVDKGGFSEELYRRINEVEIKVPPLRERKDDIPLLASALIDELCARQRREITLSGEVIRAFQYHDWPGNVRQMKNVIERASILARGNKLTLRELPGEFLAPRKKSNPGRLPMKTLKELEMQAISETLRKCNGNKSRTARMLGISRKAFYKRLREADRTYNPY